MPVISGLTGSASNFQFQTRHLNLLVTHRKLSDVFQGAFRGTRNPRFPPAHVEKVNILTQADTMSKKMARKIISKKTTIEKISFSLLLLHVMLSHSHVSSF